MKRLWEALMGSIDWDDVAGIEEFEHGLLITLKDNRQFRGDCTVWHHYPSGKRAGTWLEGELADIWTRHKWGGVEEIS